MYKRVHCIYRRSEFENGDMEFPVLVSISASENAKQAKAIVTASVRHNMAADFPEAFFTFHDPFLIYIIITHLRLFFKKPAYFLSVSRLFFEIFFAKTE